MNITISGKNIDITEGLRTAVEEKLSRLEKYFSSDTIVNVTLSVTKKRFQKIEVTIPVKGHIIRAEQESDDMYVTIDLVEEVIEAQLKKFRQKLISQHQNAESFKDLCEDMGVLYSLKNTVENLYEKVSGIFKRAKKAEDKTEAQVEA